MHLICLWLSIATVFTHAVLPVGSPLAKTSGSAFSASTVEVSLRPSRRGDTAQLKKQLSLEADEIDASAGGPVDSPGGPLPSAPSLVEHWPSASDTFAAPDNVRLGHIPVGYLSRAPPRA